VKSQTEALKQGLFVNRNVEKKPAIVLKKIGDSCYFGNEEGFDQQEKQYTIRVSSYTCSLIQISKKKIRQNANYEPALMEHILQRSEKKKTFFEREKINAFERSKQMFGKKASVIEPKTHKSQAREDASLHQRQTSNASNEQNLVHESQSVGVSPVIKIKNYGESLLKAAELYKDPGNIDSSVYNAPKKKTAKSPPKLKTLRQEPEAHVEYQNEASNNPDPIPSNRGLLHIGQHPSLIESMQKIQKEHSKLSQMSQLASKSIPSTTRTRQQSSMSQEEPFDQQADYFNSTEVHPIYEAIRIEEEETRNQQRGMLGPRTQMLDQVNQVLIQSMLTEKQQIRMQKKHKTYKPAEHHSSQLSAVSWGEETAPVASFHVGSSLNNYSSIIVKDIRKLVQSNDQPTVLNSLPSASVHERLESEASAVTMLKQLQKGTEILRVLDVGKADHSSQETELLQIKNHQPKIYSREKRLSALPAKETSTFFSGAELPQTVPQQQPFSRKKQKSTSPQRYEAASNPSQPYIQYLEGDIQSEYPNSKGSSKIIGEAIGLSAAYSVSTLQTAGKRIRAINRGKTKSTVLQNKNQVESYREMDPISFIGLASRSPFSERAGTLAKHSSFISIKHPTINIQEVGKLPRIKQLPKEEFDEKAFVINTKNLPGTSPNMNLVDFSSGTLGSDRTNDGVDWSVSPAKKGYKISSNSKGFASHRKLLQRPNFKKPEDNTRVSHKTQLTSDGLKSVNGVLEGPIQQSLQLKFNRAAKAQQLQPIKVTELLPRMKQMLQDSVELLASKPQQLVL
jgi:hypothetical protein